MDCKALIALLAFIPALAFGQPMTVSELAWPNSNGGAVPCSQIVAATNMVLVVPTNTATPITLAGKGGLFSILVAPTNGTITGLNTATGDATYTTTSTSGVDYLEFAVTSAGGCVASAPVDIDIITTNTVDCFSLSSTNHTSHQIFVLVNTGQFGLDVVVCLQYTNADCVATNECRESFGAGVVAFNVLEGVGCPNNSLCFSWTNPPAGCLTPTGTNSFNFSLTSTNYDNLDYTNWTICNPNPFAVTYKVFGVYSYTNSPTNSSVYMQITTNGNAVNPAAGTVGSVLHAYPSIDPVSGSDIVFSNGFTVGAGVLNLPVYIRVEMNKSPIDAGAPPSFSGSFTNSFQ